MGAPLTLVIANKNYSSWSSRPWLAMTELGIPFQERMIKFDSDDWARNIARLSPSQLVPVLWEGEPGEGFATFDTLAIIERLHELFPDKGLWPRDARARAHARSLAADFHAGYRALRGAMPMNLRASYPGKGMSPEVAQDIARLTGHWARTRRAFGAGGRFLFGAYCAADAYFTPVASRFVTYGVALVGDARSYQDALLGTTSFGAWRKAALEETEFVAADEPYATPR
ncbi:MAG: glutathione S-transferase [Burkholderiales bacterium]|nr:glutathione S-transferase [Burkholderiales bacterium]